MSSRNYVLKPLPPEQLRIGIHGKEVCKAVQSAIWKKFASNPGPACLAAENDAGVDAGTVTGGA